LYNESLKRQSLLTVRLWARYQLVCAFWWALSADVAKELFDAFCEAVAQQHQAPQTGQFGADMQVALVNDGPVTFWLET